MSIRNLLLIAALLAWPLAPIAAQDASGEPAAHTWVEDEAAPAADEPGETPPAEATPPAEEEPPAAEEPGEETPPAEEPPAEGEPEPAPPPQDPPAPPPEEPPPTPPQDPPGDTPPGASAKPLGWFEISVFSPGLVQYDDAFKARLNATGTAKLKMLRRQVNFIAKFNPDEAIRAKAKTISDDISAILTSRQ